jgi:RES domain-containing protein
MDIFEKLLVNTALQLSTQAIANHQVSCHLMDLAFTEKLVKMDLAESFAAQGLSHASAPRDAIAATTAGGGYPAHERKVA